MTVFGSPQDRYRTGSSDMLAVTACLGSRRLGKVFAERNTEGVTGEIYQIILSRTFHT